MLAFLTLADAAAAATAVGIIFAAWALFLQRGQARTQFEDAITRQYRELIRPELLSNALLVDVLGQQPESERERFKHIYLYLDLCNEQVFLRAIGRVSRATWNVQWSEGIRENVEGNPIIASTWQVIKDSTDNFNELRAFERGDWKDPRSWDPPWRRGLVRLGLATIQVPQAPE